MWLRKPFSSILTQVCRIFGKPAVSITFSMKEKLTESKAQIYGHNYPSFAFGRVRIVNSIIQQASYLAHVSSINEALVSLAN